MSWRTVYERQHGSIAAALVVEGLPFMFSTTDHSFADLNSTAGAQYPVQIPGSLSTKGLEWTHETDFKNGDLKSSGITFRLVDVDYQPSGAGTTIDKWKITELMAGRSSAGDYTLGADVAVGAATVQLNTIAGLGSPGNLYLNLETIHYTGTAAGPPRATGCTKGYFYSADQAHDYDATLAGAEEPTQPLVPRVGTSPFSWIGRRCRLYLAELRSDGTLAPANLVWRGRIMDDVQLGEDGASWVVHAQPLIEAQHTQIPAITPSASLRGILLDDGTIDWYATDIATGIVYNGQFTIATSYANPENLCLALTDGLNASLDAHVTVNAAVQYEIVVEGGVITCRQIVPEFGPGAYWVRLRTFSNVLGALVFNGLVGQLSEISLPLNGAQIVRGKRAPATAAWVSASEPRTIRVSNASSFVAIDPAVQPAAQGDGFRVESIVTIGERVFFLLAVNAATFTLTVQEVRAALSEDGTDVEWIVQYVGDAPLIVKEGLALSGMALKYWRDGFLSNTLVPEEWKGGLRSTDFDWTEIEALASGGNGDRRQRILLEPQSFREMLLEDMRWSGLVPSISASTGATLSVRKLRAPTLRAAVGTLGAGWYEAGVIPRPRKTRGLIINDVTVVNSFPVLTAPGDRGPEWTYRIPLRESQQAYGMVQKVEIKSTASRLMEPAAAGEHAYALAQEYFSLFGYEHWVVEQPCTIRAAGLRPGEVVGYAHWVAVNGTTRGIDEDSPAAALVTKIHVSPFDASCKVGLLWLVDGDRRSGFHLAARITAKTDRGAGTEPNRYALTFTPQTYVTKAPPDAADGVASNEGPWFDLFPSTIWVLQEWDDDSAPVAESVTLSTDPYNAAVGNFIFVTAMPAANPAVGTWILRPPAYGAAPTTAAQREFLHIADEASGGLFSNGARGFKPA